MSCCVNRGGSASLIRLTAIPELEQETELDSGCLAALEVWQARPGEVLTALAPDQTAFRVRLTDSGDGRARCVPFERLRQSPESPLVIEIYQALPDKERFETLLPKLTELGACRIVPMQTERSPSLAEPADRQAEAQRWAEVLRRAARQCRRAMIPELYEAVTFAEAMVLAGQAELSLLLNDADSQWGLQEGIGSFRPQSTALMIGPAEGFSPAERELARNAGILPVSLGPRLLRPATAAIVGLGIVQNLLGDLR